MAELFKVNAPVRKPLFEGVQGENEARSIQFDITPWVEELGDGAVTATAKRSQDSQPYPVTVTKDGTTVTWKPTSTDTAYAGVGSFQLEYTVDSVLAKTCIWSTMVAPSLDPAGDPPDPYDNWLAEMREIAADAIQAAQDADESADDAQAEVYEAEAWAKGTKNGAPVSSSDAQYQNNSKYFAEESYKNAEAWAVGQRGGVDVPSTDPTYENNAKYWAEQSLANQYGAFIVKSASGDIASFADGGDDIPMKSLKVAIVPKQAGSGDPSPTNVRPISGWTDADVKQRGKNLVEVDQYTMVRQYGYGSSYELDDSSIKLTTPTTAWPNLWLGFDNVPTGVPITMSGTYTNPNTGAKPNIQFGCVDPSDIYFSNLVGFGTAVITTTGTGTFNFTGTIPEGKYCAIRATASNTSDASMVTQPFVVSNIQIEVGSTPTEYEAPKPITTTPVPLGQTVYGGEVNPISGELVIDKAMQDLGGLNYVAAAQSGVFYTSTPISTAKATALFLSSQYKRVTSIQAVKDNDNSAYIAGDKTLYLNNTAYSDPAAFKTAMSGVQLVYELATPTTVQLTPTQVSTLLGTNNVWADCGSVAVEYRADPTLAYAELQALILENI